MRVLEGKSVFSGIAIGKISILQKADTSVKRTKVENPEAEITRVQEAKRESSLNSFRNCMIRHSGK